MTTITIKKGAKKDIDLLVDIAKRLGIELTVSKDGRSSTPKDSEKAIQELSKKVKSAGTRKAFGKMGLDYDSYCR